MTHIRRIIAVLLYVAIAHMGLRGAEPAHAHVATSSSEIAALLLATAGGVDDHDHLDFGGASHEHAHLNQNAPQDDQPGDKNSGEAIWHVHASPQFAAADSVDFDFSQRADILTANPLHNDGVSTRSTTPLIRPPRAIL